MEDGGKGAVSSEEAGVMWKWSRLSGAQRNPLIDASLPLMRGFLLAQSAGSAAGRTYPGLGLEGPSC